MTQSMIDLLVHRFLVAKLPESVRVDPCAMPETTPYLFERTGTNLLTDSEARQVLEQVLEGLGPALEVAAERLQQIEVKGWTPEHDDSHEAGTLAIAAARYAVLHTDATVDDPHDVEGWIKPKDPRRNLIRAGALILAEIERLDRAVPVVKP